MLKDILKFLWAFIKFIFCRTKSKYLTWQVVIDPYAMIYHWHYQMTFLNAYYNKKLHFDGCHLDTAKHSVICKVKWGAFLRENVHALVLLLRNVIHIKSIYCSICSEICGSSYTVYSYVALLVHISWRILKLINNFIT